MYGRGHFVGANRCDVSQRYRLDKRRLGAGGRAYVVEGSNASTGAARAIKVCSKAKAEQDYGGSSFEVNMMQKLDHPNIVRLFDSFEDEDSIYLVLELCRGGEVLQCASRWTPFAESDAQILMLQLLKAVRYLHKLQIRHGDLIPGNILMLNHNPPPENVLKVTDFGGLQVGESAVDDIVSCGTFMQIVLSLVPPAHQQPGAPLLRKDSMDAYPPPVFNAAGIECDVSKRGRDLLQRLKDTEPRRKLTAGQALGHDWLRRLCPYYTVKKGDLPPELFERICCFPSHSMLKKVAFMAIADEIEQVDPKAVEQLRAYFAKIDFNQDGFVDPFDIRKAMKKSSLPVNEGITRALRNSDVDGTGVLDFTVFLAMCLDKANLSDKACKAAWDFFDPQQAGKVSLQQMRALLLADQPKDQRTEKAADDALRGLGGKSGFIKYAGFCKALLRDGSEAAADADGALSPGREAQEADDGAASVLQIGYRETIRSAKAEIVMTEERRFRQEQAAKEKRLAARRAKKAKQKRKLLAAGKPELEAGGVFASFAEATAGDDVGCMDDFDDFDEEADEDLFSDDDASAFSDDIFSDGDCFSPKEEEEEDQLEEDEARLNAFMRCPSRPCQSVIVHL